MTPPRGGDSDGVVTLAFRSGREKGKLLKVKPTLKTGRYKVEEIFAYGGMGVLLRAADRRVFNNEVLIKGVKYQASEFALDRQKALYNIYQLRQMFKRERRMICELRNRGINALPHVNDFFFDENPELTATSFPFGELKAKERHAFLGVDIEVAAEPYLVMERINGVPFASCLADLPRRRVLLIVRDVLVTLAKMHESRVRADGSALRIIYLDLKPENVLVDRHGRITLIDFGGAMPVVDGKKRKEQRGALTHGYAAPELATLFTAKDRVDWRADLYSAGAVLWRAFTGRDPMGLADPTVNPFPVLSPDELPNDLPGSLRDCIARAVAREVDERWQSAGEMAHCLTDLVEKGEV
jgi:serine/threonine protein kinase